MSRARYCSFYKAVNGSWYMELAGREYAGREEAYTYGPFVSFDKAYQYRLDNFSNPGGYSEDDSGDCEVPQMSPNGEAVQHPGRNHLGQPWQ